MLLKAPSADIARDGSAAEAGAIPWLQIRKSATSNANQTFWQKQRGFFFHHELVEL